MTVTRPNFLIKCDFDFAFVITVDSLETTDGLPKIPRLTGYPQYVFATTTIKYHNFWHIPFFAPAAYSIKSTPLLFSKRGENPSIERGPTIMCLKDILNFVIYGSPVFLGWFIILI